MKRHEHYVGGRWTPPVLGKYMGTVAPATREVWAEVAEGTAEDVDAAVTAARTAADDGSWASDPRRRGQVLRRLADLLDGRAEEMAEIESRDNGKTIREELAMNRRTGASYRFAASLADTVSGAVPSGQDPSIVSMTLREPYGVIGIQTPWNTPGVILGQSAAPALAAGNTLVIKPSEHAPCSTLAFAELVIDAGFPDGVVNVVTGLGHVVGAAICSHRDVDKLVFTGSPDGGRIVARHAAERLVPSVLELGGKSANIIFADADLDAAVAGAVAGFTSASGQSCVCGSRILIESAVYDEVVARMLDSIGRLRIGHPGDPLTDIGPMCNADQQARVQRLVSEAIDDGAVVLCGGRTPPAMEGWYFEPTLFGDVDNSNMIAQEEVFGPVAACIRFDGESQAVAIANDSRFGLAAGIWTSDLGRAHRVGRRLHAGSVWVNQYRRGDSAFPFGGYGESGYGRVSGLEGYLEMTRTKSLQIAI